MSFHFSYTFPRPPGFTLIELLIVVAIIAILAAIAVPNFLEAQMRVKVSRVKSDLRVIAGALEAYATDQNAYPPHRVPPGVEVPYPDRFTPLSTPVGYLTAIPARDIFFVTDDLTPGSSAQWISYFNFKSFPDTQVLFPLSATERWLMRSRGPDTASEPNAVRDSYFTMGLAAGPSWTYDPTNGTVSRGDLFRTAAQW